MPTNLHQIVSIPELLWLGGLVQSVEAGHSAVTHGRVKIEEWTIGMGQDRLPRWVLRGVRISVGDRSIHISDDGSRIVKTKAQNEL